MSTDPHGPELLTREQVKEAAARAVERALVAHHGGPAAAQGAPPRFPRPKIMGLIAIPHGDKFQIQEISTGE